MKKSSVFAILTLVLAFQSGCNFNITKTDDLFPQITGKFTRTKDAVFSGNNPDSLKGDLSKLADTMTITDKMVYGSGTFNHILQFDVQSDSKKVGGKFAYNLSELTHTGNSFPNFSPLGKTLYFEQTLQVVAWCYIKFYLSVFVPPHEASPDLDNLKDIYISYRYSYDKDGKVITDPLTGQPQKELIDKSIIEEESPVNKKAYETFMTQYEENEGIRLPIIVVSSFDSDFTGCDSENVPWPILNYRAGSMHLDFFAKSEDVVLSSPSIVTDGSNPTVFGNDVHDGFNVLTSAFNFRTDNSSSSAADSKPESYSDADMKKYFSEKKAENKSYRSTFGEDNYRKKVNSLAAQACKKDSCPKVIVQKGKGKNIAFYTVEMKPALNGELKVLSVVNTSLKNITIIPVDEDSSFDIGEYKAVGIVNNGSYDLGGELSASYRANQGLILKAVQAASQK